MTYKPALSQVRQRAPLFLYIFPSLLPIRFEAEAEGGVVGIPHREIGVPEVVIEVEIEILRFFFDVILQQAAAEGGDERAIEALDREIGVAHRLIDAGDELAIDDLVGRDPGTELLNLPLLA